MRVVMEIRRSAGRYEGSLTRSGEQRWVRFVGVLELVDAIERLESYQGGAETSEGDGDGNPRPVSS